MRKLSLGINNKKELVDNNNKYLSIKEQCRLLDYSRSNFYYKNKNTNKKEFTDEEEKAMKIIDKDHTEFPCYGARSHREALKKHNIFLSRHKVKKLMNHMHIYSLAPQPKTSIPNKKAKCAPYLLSGLPIRYPNQVWATDITYIPLNKGHVYLSVVIDLYSRYIVGWRLHETLEAHECVLCFKRCIELHGKPSITNTDQGATYTSDEFCNLLKENLIRQSMDGARRWADNIYIERWFRNLKHENLYLNEYNTFKELKSLIDEYVDAYNTKRLHSSLNYETPFTWYYSGINSDGFNEIFSEKNKTLSYNENVA